MSEWQSAPSYNKAKKKRAFVGNLNFSSNEKVEEKVRELFSRSAIPISGLEIVPLKQPNTKCYALVQCDVPMAIKCLDGLRFDGNVLSVKHEKKQTNNKKKGMGFGGSWATPSSTGASRSKKPLQKVKSSPQTALDSTKVAETHLSNALEQMNVTSTKGAVSKVDDISAFHSKCKVSLSQLMQDYGDYDPDYEKMKAMNISSETSNSSQKTISSEQKPYENSGMLVPNGQAPIHIEIVSFGFKYSVPPQAREGWSHSNPLSPFDLRDLPRCPHHVAKLSGLSHKVKRAMLSLDLGSIDGGSDSEDEDNGERDDKPVRVNPLVSRCEDVAKTIMNALEQAINEADHGYANPLEMKIFLGSEYGRHRSVVLCENLGQKIRSLLRANEGFRISQPVSVSTRHRDVDQNHRDEEAFGTDLRRKHEAEVRRKKRQDWLEGNDDGW